jgi:antitoxin component of MazEF toxin-antitoxin module
MKKDDVLFKIPRTIRRGNGSLTIALPPEVKRALRIENDEEVNIVIFKSGRIEIQKGDK